MYTQRLLPGRMPPDGRAEDYHGGRRGGARKGCASVVARLIQISVGSNNLGMMCRGGRRGVGFCSAILIKVVHSETTLSYV